MILKANSKVLVLRFNNYKKWNFIEEHTRILNSTKYVWILKAGKYIKEQKDYADRKVVECYSRTHRSNGKYNSNIVIMVR